MATQPSLTLKPRYRVLAAGAFWRIYDHLRRAYVTEPLPAPPHAQAIDLEAAWTQQRLRRITQEWTC